MELTVGIRLLTVFGLIGKTLSCCPCNWEYHDGSCYQLFTVQLTYPNAIDACNNLGATLASLKTESVNDVLQAQMDAVSANAGYIGVDHYTNGSAYWHYDDSLVADGYDPLKRQDIGDTGCGFQLQGNDMATCVNEDAGLYFCQVNSSCTSVTTASGVVPCVTTTSTSTVTDTTTTTAPTTTSLPSSSATAKTSAVSSTSTVTYSTPTTVTSTSTSSSPGTRTITTSSLATSTPNTLIPITLTPTATKTSGSTTTAQSPTTTQFSTTTVTAQSTTNHLTTPATSTLTATYTAPTAAISTPVSISGQDEGRVLLSPGEKVTTFVWAAVGALLLLSSCLLGFLLYKNRKKRKVEELEYQEQLERDEKDQAHQCTCNRETSDVKPIPKQSTIILSRFVSNPKLYGGTLAYGNMQGPKNVTMHSLGSIHSLEETRAQAITPTDEKDISLVDFLSVQPNNASGTLGASHSRLRLLPKATPALKRFQSIANKANNLSEASKAFGDLR